MKYTPNLNLKKPAKTDPVLIDDLNENADIIDQLVGTLQHQAAILKPEGGKLWHFDTSLESTDGIKPLEGAVATLRPDEGRFGGAMAVEEGTTNLIPLDKQKFEGWVSHDGASVTLTQNQVVPEWGALDATRIQSSGGTNTLKYSYTIGTSSDACAWSIWIKNNGLSTVFFEGNRTLAQQAILPGESKRVIITRSAGDAITIALRFYTNAIDDAMDITAWRPQVEAKPFATSFVDGTRAAGRLEYPQSIWNYATGTFAAWVKTPTDVSTDRVLTIQWAKDDIGAHTRFGIRMNTTGRFVVSYGSADTLTTADSYNDGEWHHVALTWVDGTADIHFYVDGERVASASEPISVRNPGGRYRGVIPIGHRGYTYNDQWWNGLIDELLILPYAATEEEIKGWYEAKKPFIDQDEINTIDQKLKELAIGTRTPDQTQVPTSPGSGTLSQILSWFANRIKAITGKTNWWEAPPTTLQAAKTHMDAAAPHSGHETPSGAQTKVDTHAAVQASLSQLGHVNHAVLTTTLNTTWQGSQAPYTKTQTVNGLLATDTPIVDVVMSGDFGTDEARIEAWGYVYRITTANNSITLYATEKPTVSLPIQLKVVR